jgi:glutamate dehydrogenase
VQTVQGFAEYFSRLDPEPPSAPRRPAGALLSHLQLGGFAKRRPSCGSQPHPGEDGWWSRHSVIRVVNDDMPFLVDSTSLEINRQG